MTFALVYHLKSKLKLTISVKELPQNNIFVHNAMITNKYIPCKFQFSIFKYGSLLLFRNK